MTNKAFFGGGLLSDSISSGEGAKPTLVGLFTDFHVWNVPCTRSCNFSVSVFNVQEGKYEVMIKHVNPGTTTGLIIAKAQAYPKKHVLGHFINIPLVLNISDIGVHKIIATSKNVKNKLHSYFNVIKLPWPEFTEAEISHARKQNVPNRIQAHISCVKCGHGYVIEEVVEDALKLTKGAVKFPEDGKFVCAQCNEILKVKDLQGQLRQSLKDMINANMKAAS